MKTSKQTSKEIMEKIEQRKYARMQTRKKIRRVWAAAIVLGFLVPTTLFSFSEEFNPYRPLSHPFNQEQHDEDEQEPDSEMQRMENDKFEISLLI